MTKSYIKDYPRPQLVRSSWENLNGSWDFSFDDQNCGETSGWYRDFPKQMDIQVPFTYETKTSGIGDETAHDNIWYHKTVTLAKENLNGKKVMLHFEGVDYTAKLWVNGTYVGEHTGAYSRFSFDITKYAVEGENQLTLKAEDSMDDQQPRGKQRWIGENFGCWYIQTTGIWKTVWLEYLPETYVEHVKMTPVMAERSLALEFDVIADNYSPELMLCAEVTFDGKFVNKVMIPVTKKHISTSINVFNLEVHEWGIHAWAPEHPNLYDISFTLLKGCEVIDTALSYFGMRDIRIEGRNILLNGCPIYQRLILDQGYWKDSHLTPPSEEALIEDIDKIMALGYNGLRKHQKTEDERFLYWCDVKGVYVWSEVAASYTFSDYAVEQFTNQWMEIVKQNYNHPSIITWTPFNESWGVPNIETDKMQQDFTQSIYYLTKSFDKNRPVIVNDGWEHTISDIITLHDYEEVGELFYDRYANHKDEILTTEVYHSRSKSAFANGFTYKGQPIIISEYGGIAFQNGETGWGYGNKVTTEEEFLRRFDSITSAIKEVDYICGYCYTQVSDVQQEINGLMDMERNFKIDADKIKEINMKDVGVWMQR